MKEYVLIFRMDITTPEAQPSAEMMQEYMEQWTTWIHDIDAKKQLAEGGNHFSPFTARVLRPNNVITEGPYTKDKESVAGYLIVLAENIENAVLIAKKCPILNGEGTSVEVREAETPEA